MPSKPLRPCRRHPWILVEPGAGCPACAEQPALPRPERPRDTRPSAARRGYGQRHREMRDDLIKRRRWCEDPYGRHPYANVPGTVRDHVVPLNQGGKDNKSNEQLLCVSCHNYKIAHDGSRRVGGCKSSHL